MSSPAEYVLPRTSPEEQGIASTAILDFVKAIENSGQEIHSFMLLRHGAVVAEGWWWPYKPELPHLMFSLSKSFTSTAVGMAIAEGFFTVDDPVISFFPDDLPDSVSDGLAAMRVRHLLTMSTGHDVQTFPFMYGHAEGNWPKGFLEIPLAYQPGEHFFYNTGATYMLSEIVQRTTGQNLMGYLTPRLFEPLGINGATWDETHLGVNLGGVGLSLKTEDIARFGQLYHQKGMWNGKRLLSEAWIAEATSKQISNGDASDNDWTQGYGYQFWRCQHGLYRGDGAFGQFCIVMDEYDAVLAITAAAQDMQAVMTLAWDLLPALGTDPLPENLDAHQQLVEQLSGLKYDPLKGMAASLMATKVSGQTYVADENTLGIESLSFAFTDTEAVLNVKTTHAQEQLSAGYGEWKSGQTSLFNEIWLPDARPYIASGVWQNDSQYIMLVRLTVTPYVYTLDCQFDGDKVVITVHINVSLESTDPQTVTAKLQST